MPSNDNNDDLDKLLGNYEKLGECNRERAFPLPPSTKRRVYSLSSPKQLVFNKGDLLINKSEKWLNLSTHAERCL